MENVKDEGEKIEAAAVEQNPNPPEEEGGTTEDTGGSLNQEDDDNALSRTLQEQEWAYPRIAREERHDQQQQHHGEGVAAGPEVVRDNEAPTRARVIRRLMLGLIGRVNEPGVAEDEMEDNGIDLDDLSYEELLAIGEIVGPVSKGVSANTIASLASVVYEDGVVNDSMCVICQLDYDAGEELNLLGCKHSYHSQCLRDWLRNNKVCPVCSAEVSHAPVQ